jgi:hypothetical protein
MPVQRAMKIRAKYVSGTFGKGQVFTGPKCTLYSGKINGL